MNPACTSLAFGTLRRDVLLGPLTSGGPGGRARRSPGAFTRSRRNVRRITRASDRARAPLLRSPRRLRSLRRARAPSLTTLPRCPGNGVRAVATATRKPSPGCRFSERLRNRARIQCVGVSRTTAYCELSGLFFCARALAPSRPPQPCDVVLHARARDPLIPRVTFREAPYNKGRKRGRGFENGTTSPQRVTAAMFGGQRRF